MTVPDFQRITLPLLRLLADGETRRLSDLTDQIADQFHLTESERSELLPSGQRRLLNRVAWARTYMAKAGLLEGLGVGAYVLLSAAGRFWPKTRRASTYSC